MKQKTLPPSSQEEPVEESQKRSRRHKLWEWSEFGERSGWDWMQPLIILVVIGVAGLWFKWAQNDRQREDAQTRVP